MVAIPWVPFTARGSTATGVIGRRGKPRNFRKAIMSRAIFSSLACVLALGMFPGCGGGSGVKTVPVTATVTYNGKPVSGAAIGFSPAGGAGGPAAPKAPGEKVTPQSMPHGAHGITDASGKAKMWTIEPGDGVQPGSYLVTIEKAGKDDVPAKYAKKNDLTFTAKEGGPTTVTFDLKDDGAAPAAAGKTPAEPEKK